MKKLTLNEGIFQTVTIIAFCIFMVICVYPFYYILIYSLSNSTEALKGVTFYPRGFTLENYERMFKLDRIYHSFFISGARPSSVHYYLFSVPHYLAI